MDGTYNNPFAHANSPLSPDTPTSGSYQVNVNRKKTRKWVQAKVPNYDGDDWGADEFDDDDEEDDQEPPPPPVPRVTTGLRPIGQRLPSESKPSPRVAAAAASSARSSSGPPSLRLQTQQSAASASTAPSTIGPTSQTPVSTGVSAQAGLPSQQAKPLPSATGDIQGQSRNVSSPVVGRNASPGPASGSFPPRKSSIDQQSTPEAPQAAPVASIPSSIKSGHSSVAARAASPAGRSTPDRGSPLVQSAVVHRRIEDENRSATSSPQPSVDDLSVKSADREVHQAQTEHDDTNKPQRVPPTLDSIAERKSEYGLDRLQGGSRGTSQDRSESMRDNEIAAGDIDRKRLSTSPQLPDVARMSFFGPDLFSSSSKDQPSAPSVPGAFPVTPFQDGLRQAPPTAGSQTSSTWGAPPAGSAGERSATSTPQSLSVVSPAAPSGPPSITQGSGTNSLRETSSGPPSESKGSASPKPLSIASESQSPHDDVSSISEKPASSARGTPDISNQKPVLYPGTDPRSVPPLRTPSPNAQESAPSTGNPDSAVSGTGISFSHTVTPTEPLQPRQPAQSPSDYEPQPIRRELTISTVTSSPVKESDVLSDEIMRSLSPAATPSLLPPGDDGDNRKSVAPGGRDTRASTYTLSGYDDYWADTGDKAGDGEITPVPPVPPVPEPTKEPTRSITMPINKPAEQAQAQAEARRRFSWEAEFDDGAKVVKTEAPSQAAVPSITSPSSLGQSDVQSPKDFVSSINSPVAETSQPRDNPTIVVPPAGGVSHQVSNASTTQPTQQQQLSMLEPPSPVSVLSDMHNATDYENRRVSLLEDKHSISTSTPPPEDHTALRPISQPPAYSLSSPTASEPKVTLGEMMGKSTPTQRITKYEETRIQYSAWESGLENWITALKDEHPEFANVTASYNGSLPVARPGHAPSASASSTQPQQPYYQQYLNASSPTTSAPGTSRSRLGGLPLPSQTASSAFGGSSNQIGTKSKELMHSAGKMGKGLLSKGKSKLRGTGDKGESSPPPTTQPKLKNERRASWSLGLSARSRTDGPASHSNIEMMINNPSTQFPQLSQPTSAAYRSSYPGPHPQHGLPAPVPQTGPSTLGPLLQRASRYVHDEQEETAFVKSPEEVLKWQIPTPVSKDSTPWNPFKDTNLDIENESDVDAHNGVKLGEQDLSRTDTSRTELSPRSSGDWVMVPEQSTPQTSSHPLQQKAEQTQIRASSQLSTTPRDTPVKSQYQTITLSGDVTPRSPEPAPSSLLQQQAQTPTPQRRSSFVGLPPIRRGSTFGLSKATKQAAERFSLDDDEEETVGMSEAEVDEKGPMAFMSYTWDPQPVEEEGESSTRGATFSSQTLGNEQLPGHMQGQPPIPHFQMPPNVPGLPYNQDQLPPRGPGPQYQQAQLPLQAPGPFPQQNAAFGAPPMMGPPNMMGNPIQKFPPATGPWQIQESHLSEPLHTVTRNRAGTGSSQQSYLEYDKETGVSYPIAPQSPNKLVKKTPDVPPSSTQRYPELFHRPQQPGGQQWLQGDAQAIPPGQQYQGRASLDGSIRPGTAASGDGEERGRARRSTGMLKDIGSRFRWASTDRKNSFADQRPPSAEPRADDVSESSIAPGDIQDRKNRRSSFLSGRLGRPSIDRRSSRDESTAQVSERPSSALAGAPVQAQREQKHYFFSGGLGATSSSQLKLKAMEKTRSSSSSMVNEPSAALEGPDQALANAPAQAQGERKHSIFSGGLGATSSSHLKLNAMGQTRSSNSSMVNEPSGIPNNSTTPSKQRFSGFGTKGGMGGVFHRASPDPSQKPGTSQSMVSTINNHLQQDPNTSMGPSVVPPPGIARSSTTGPIPYGSSSGSVVRGASPEDAKPRKRRGSAGGLLSGFFGQSSAPKESHHPYQSASTASPLDARQPMLRRMTGSTSLLDTTSQSPQSPPHTPQSPRGNTPAAGIPLPAQDRSSPEPVHVVTSGRRVSQTPTQQSQPSPLRQETQSWENIAPKTQSRSSSPRPQNGPVFGGSPRSPTFAGRVSHENPLREGSGTAIDKSPQQGLGNFPKTNTGLDSTAFDRTHSRSASSGWDQVPTNTGSGPAHDNHSRVVSSPPGDPSPSTTQQSKVAYQVLQQSLDSAVQPGPEAMEVQKVGTMPPGFTQSPYPSVHHSHPTSIDDEPRSPVSQLSKTGPPSIVSSARGQSPHLASAATSVTGQVGRDHSQPPTPALSEVSHPPSTTQQQSFAARMSPTPEQSPQSFQSQQPVHPPGGAQMSSHRNGQSVPQSMPQSTSHMTPHMAPQKAPQALHNRAYIGTQGVQNPQMAYYGQQAPQFPQQHPGGQPFPRQPQQGMVQNMRPPYQTSNSVQFTVPTKNYGGRPCQQILQQGPPRQGSPSSMWKGLRTRMSGNLSINGSQGQANPSGTEKKSTNKFLSAFKRSSKQAGPTQGHPVGIKVRPQHSPQPGQQFQEYQQGPPMTSLQQQQYWRQAMQTGSPPMNQGPPQASGRAPASFTGSMGQTQSQPMIDPRQHPSPPQQGSQGFQDAPQMQRPAQKPEEQQYDQVPIPQPYRPVNYNGATIKAPYNPGQPASEAHHPQQGQMTQQMQAQQQQSQSRNANMAPRQASSPMVLQQQQRQQLRQQPPMAPPSNGRHVSDSEVPQAAHSSHGTYTSTTLRGPSLRANPAQHDDSKRQSLLSMSPRTASSPPQDAAWGSREHLALLPPRDRSHSRQNSADGFVATRDQNIDPGRGSPVPSPPPSQPISDESRMSTSRQQSMESIHRGSPLASAPQHVKPVARRSVIAEVIDSAQEQYFGDESPQEQPSHTLAVTASDEGRALKGDESRISSRSPPNGKTSPANANIQGTSTTNGKSLLNVSSEATNNRPFSIQKTPVIARRPPQDTRANSHMQTEESGTTLGKDVETREVNEGAAVRSPAQSEDAKAELEDTAEAHMRRVRLNSQEEKIHYDPDADSDGEMPPQMSATSYPGQEWNPYGMPAEYGEWDG